MPFSPPLPPKHIFIVLAVILAVLLVVAAAVWLRPAATGQAEKAAIVKETPVAAGEVTLPGRGQLSPLHMVAANDPALRDMIARLGQLPADEIFIDSQNADMLIVSLLFRWAGVEDAEAGAYGPFIDSRIVAFMKRIGSLPADLLAGQEIAADDSITLNTRWFGIFDYYRTRLLIQLSGRAVYNQAASYDLKGDRIIVSGEISPDFVRQFQGKLHQSRNSGQAMHGLLDFIKATKGFEALNDAEQDLIMSLNATGPAPAP